jgi:hypothetical protein
MPHCYSPDALRTRRARAAALGFLRPVPVGFRMLQVEVPLLHAVAAGYRSLRLHRDHDLAAGVTSHHGRLASIAAFQAGAITREASVDAARAHRDAGRTKHDISKNSTMKMCQEDDPMQRCDPWRPATLPGAVHSTEVARAHQDAGRTKHDITMSGAMKTDHEDDPLQLDDPWIHATLPVAVASTIFVDPWRFYLFNQRTSPEKYAACEQPAAIEQLAFVEAAAPQATATSGLLAISAQDAAHTATIESAIATFEAAAQTAVATAVAAHFGAIMVKMNNIVTSLAQIEQLLAGRDAACDQSALAEHDSLTAVGQPILDTFAETFAANRIIGAATAARPRLAMLYRANASCCPVPRAAEEPQLPETAPAESTTTGFASPDAPTAIVHRRRRRGNRRSPGAPGRLLTRRAMLAASSRASSPDASDPDLTAQPITMDTIVLHNRFETLADVEPTFCEVPTASVSSSDEDVLCCEHCSSPTGPEYYFCLSTETFHCEGCHSRLCAAGLLCMPCCRS